MPTNAKKLAYAAKLHDLIDNSKNVFIISVDNVGSKQMQTIRKNLRGQAVVLMGKNVRACPDVCHRAGCPRPFA